MSISPFQRKCMTFALNSVNGKLADVQLDRARVRERSVKKRYEERKNEAHSRQVQGVFSWHKEL